MKGLLIEIGVSQGIAIVFSDSQSAIHLTKNDAYHIKTKHINIKYHYIKDTIAKRDITMEKVHTADNPADVITKPLPITKFEHWLNLVGI